MVAYNNVVPNAHFKKDWQPMVKTWLNQPARKQRRRMKRAAKAERVFPRPVEGMLRPAVHGTQKRYNMKVRLGRGFTLEELKEAGISAKYAQTVGIAVDHRRKNKSLESLQANVNRLKTYMSKLVVFPRNAKKPAAGEATKEEMATAAQLEGKILPLASEKFAVEFAAITDDLKAAPAYAKLRLERMNQRQVGPRYKKRLAEEAAAAEKAKLSKS